MESKVNGDDHHHHPVKTELKSESPAEIVTLEEEENIEAAAEEEETFLFPDFLFSSISIPPPLQTSSTPPLTPSGRRCRGKRKVNTEFEDKDNEEPEVNEVKKRKRYRINPLEDDITDKTWFRGSGGRSKKKRTKTKSAAKARREAMSRLQRKKVSEMNEDELERNREKWRMEARQRRSKRKEINDQTQIQAPPKSAEGVKEEIEIVDLEEEIEGWEESARRRKEEMQRRENEEGIAVLAVNCSSSAPNENRISDEKRTRTRRTVGEDKWRENARGSRGNGNRPKRWVNMTDEERREQLYQERQMKWEKRQERSKFDGGTSFNSVLAESQRRSHHQKCKLKKRNGLRQQLQSLQRSQAAKALNERKRRKLNENEDELEKNRREEMLALIKWKVDNGVELLPEEKIVFKNQRRRQMQMPICDKTKTLQETAETLWRREMIKKLLLKARKILQIQRLVKMGMTLEEANRQIETPQQREQRLLQNRFRKAKNALRRKQGRETEISASEEENLSDFEGEEWSEVEMSSASSLTCSDSSSSETSTSHSDDNDDDDDDQDDSDRSTSDSD